MRAAGTFAAWCGEHGIQDLGQVRAFHVAAYTEDLGKRIAAPSVKLQLATIRMLFDYLMVGQVVPVNPASSVKGSKHVVKKGKTPVLSADEARDLLDTIDVSSPTALRDHGRRFGPQLRQYISGVNEMQTYVSARFKPNATAPQPCP